MWEFRPILEGCSLRTSTIKALKLSYLYSTPITEHHPLSYRCHSTFWPTLAITYINATLHHWVKYTILHSEFHHICHRDYGLSLSFSYKHYKFLAKPAHGQCIHLNVSTYWGPQSILLSIASHASFNPHISLCSNFDYFLLMKSLFITIMNCPISIACKNLTLALVSRATRKLLIADV